MKSQVSTFEVTEGMEKSGTVGVQLSSAEEEKKQVEAEIYKQFDGMDNEYLKVLQEFQKVYEQKSIYTNDFIREAKEEAKKRILELQKKYAEKAEKKRLELIEKHTVKESKEEQPKNANDQMLYELKRANNIKMWEYQLPIATTEGLKTLFDVNFGDNDFETLLETELRKLEKGSTDDKRKALELRTYIDSVTINPITEMLNKIKHTIVTLSNSKMYPALIKDGPEGINFRNVEQDLTNTESYREINRLIN